MAQKKQSQKKPANNREQRRQNVQRTVFGIIAILIIISWILALVVQL